MPDMTNHQRSADSAPRPPWSPQGEAALRAFFAELPQLKLPFFVKLVPGLFKNFSFDPSTSDMALLLENPQGSKNLAACAAVKTFLEGPRSAEQGFGERPGGQYAMRLYVSSGPAPLSGVSGTAKVIFEFDGRSIKIVEARAESFTMS